MTPRNSRAGGFFLTVSIAAGALAGIAVGSPIKGVLAGTALGILLAIATWLIDRRGG